MFTCFDFEGPCCIHCHSDFLGEPVELTELEFEGYKAQVCCTMKKHLNEEQWRKAIANGESRFTVSKE